MKRAAGSDRAAQEAESVERFRKLLESVPTVAVQGYGMDGVAHYWNKASEKLYGYSAQEAIGQSLLDLIIPPEMRAFVKQDIAQMATTGVPIPAAELSLMRKDGTRVVVFSSHTVVHMTGRDPELFCLDVDLTEQKRVEDALRKSERRFRQLFEGTVLSLSALAELRDPYTAGHQKRVAELASAIATRCGLAQEITENTKIAGFLHDVDKVSIPAEILNKPVRLNELEMSMVKQHPTASYHTLKEIPFHNTVAEIVLQHHERLDGSGYPQGFRGDAIMLEAQILAVADVVEAMTSHRPYRPALGIEDALEEIQKGAGVVYNADAVAACVALFAEGFGFDEATHPAGPAG